MALATGFLWEFAMDSNLGPFDQLIRIMIGVAAGWEFLLMPNGRWWLFFISFGFLMSGALGFCPVYTLVGASTNGAKPTR
jgi:Protein of unknown function (DUF2892)